MRLAVVVGEADQAGLGIDHLDRHLQHDAASSGSIGSTGE